jgi:hypothetical protein
MYVTMGEALQIMDKLFNKLINDIKVLEKQSPDELARNFRDDLEKATEQELYDYLSQVEIIRLVAKPNPIHYDPEFSGRILEFCDRVDQKIFEQLEKFTSEKVD